MSESDGKRTLGLRGRGPGQVKQSFSHGRTKNVVVETKRKRVVVPKPGAAKKPSQPKAATVQATDPSNRPAGISDAELERRMKALAAAKAAEGPTKPRSAPTRKGLVPKSAKGARPKLLPRNGRNRNARREPGRKQKKRSARRQRLRARAQSQSRHQPQSPLQRAVAERPRRSVSSGRTGSRAATIGAAGLAALAGGAKES